MAFIYNSNNNDITLQLRSLSDKNTHLHLHIMFKACNDTILCKLFTKYLNPKAYCFLPI